MVKQLDAQMLGKYAALGAGAVAAPALLGQIGALAPIMQNQIMATSFAGITVGAVLQSTIGVGIVDFLVYGN